jgi:Pentapeptide repeats (8 copies)
MANASDEYVAFLKHGVADWNAWRGKNPRIHPNLYEAELRETDLIGANLVGANLGQAYLRGAELVAANLTGANLSSANLSGANLFAATLVDTDLTGADLTGCRIYGVSAWGLKLEGAKQQNLIITRGDEPEITVDNIEVAQFVYAAPQREDTGRHRHHRKKGRAPDPLAKLSGGCDRSACWGHCMR